MSEDNGIFICGSCLIERGYRFPLEGHVETKRCKCDYCETWDRCYEVEDLEPVIDSKLSKGKGVSK